MCEYELAEVIEHSCLGAGGLTGFYYLATTSMAAPQRCVPAQVLSNRVIEAGDVLTTEISISYGGYARAREIFDAVADQVVASLEEVWTALADRSSRVETEEETGR